MKVDLRKARAPHILHDTVYDDDPVGILRGLAKASRYGVVAFHSAELEASAKAWAYAARAFPTDSMRQRECHEQAAKFNIWQREILDGQLATGQIGVMTLEPQDWPPMDLIRDAAKQLKAEKVRSFVH